MTLKRLFLNHCKKNNLEINSNQLELVDQLNDFYNQNLFIIRNGSIVQYN